MEAALCVRFDAGDKVGFARLIDRAKAEGLVDDYTHDISPIPAVNYGTDRSTPASWPPPSAARIIATSHHLVAE